MFWSLKYLSTGHPVIDFYQKFSQLTIGTKLSVLILSSLENKHWGKTVILERNPAIFPSVSVNSSFVLLIGYDG